jgi:hypothetical protein
MQRAPSSTHGPFVLEGTRFCFRKQSFQYVVWSQPHTEGPSSPQNVKGTGSQPPTGASHEAFSQYMFGSQSSSVWHGGPGGGGGPCVTSLAPSAVASVEAS